MPLAWNLGTLTSWNPLGHSRPVTGLLYLYGKFISPHFTNSAKWNLILLGFQIPSKIKVAHKQQCTHRYVNYTHYVLPISALLFENTHKKKLTVHWICQNTCSVYIRVSVYRNRFILNNQQDALIIPNLFCYKTTCFGHLLCPSSGVFYCTLGTGQFHAGFWSLLPSRLCLEAIIRNLHETYQCRMYSRKLLMMGREDARNM